MYSRTIKLNKGRDESIKRFHPWIFSGAIKSIDKDISEGELVRVVDHSGNILCHGYYQIGSISVRILTFDDTIINYDLIESRIKAAWDMRISLGLTSSENTNVFRLIYAEGDNLPGLIADYYNGNIVLQFHTVGMFLLREQIVKGLKSVLGEKCKSIYDKSSGTLPYKAEVKADDGFLYGQLEESEVLEYGLKFSVDWINGQKTGFFVDQRENRKLLEKYSSGKKVLNMFCYTGGFSFYAMNGGADQVTSVDISEKAIEGTIKNVELNFPNDKRHEAFVSDAFDYLRDNAEKYDIIVLDPPAFAKHRDSLKQALVGYRRLNKLAISKIKKGGIIFTFSCSQVVDRVSFRNTIFTAAAQTGRSIKIIEQMTQCADHPVNIYHPEGEYLKGLVLYVD
ncbi:MAG: class I SAM-dependent rRNA methyltransferase [Candidatus Delongbacteria bacterium]|nr:class I SAM-dependent rRNA methyltransferase [Candidatus Delongbacteria bacterium]MBN2836011.1 class I SAM-dependent rRNA methyltransferase [Candidatus Delongbacteria bacterium]